MSRPRVAPLLACLAAASLCAAGCDLFRPATPELPASQTGSGIVEDYSSPYNTLMTMFYAMYYHTEDNAASAWTGAMDSTATFRFDPSVGAVSAWDLEDEENFFSSFSNVNSKPYFLGWTEYLAEGGDKTYETTASRGREYVITSMIESEGSYVPGDTLAMGVAVLAFQKRGSQWVITTWDDRVHDLAGSFPCLSKLRAETPR